LKIGQNSGVEKIPRKLDKAAYSLRGDLRDVDGQTATEEANRLLGFFSRGCNKYRDRPMVEVAARGI
jgi:hypothetical protein